MNFSLEKLRAEVGLGIEDVKAGRVSRPTPNDIKQKALQRKNASRNDHI